MVEPRVITIGALFSQLRSVTKGLDANDLVITNGLMHARPGSTVAPTEQAIAVDETAFDDPGAPSSSVADAGAQAGKNRHGS